MHIHSLKRAALAACVVAAVAAPQAVAATVPAELRVEGGGGQDLTHGWTYFSDSATVTTDTAEPCGGTGQRKTLDGANALSIVEHARRHNTRLDPLRVSDKFDFGLLVCGIGAFPSSDSRFWTYKVNHVAPEVGAELYALKPGDDVLWAFQDIETGENTGNELELLAPRNVDAGEPFEVTVSQYDFNGEKSPAAGAQVGGTLTDAQGRATLTLSGDAPSEILRAQRATDIPSAPARVCVGRCDRIAQKRIFGTSARDVIVAREPITERVYGSGGDDRIDVRGDYGGSTPNTDRVHCGRGRDRVFADAGDRVHRSCERVTRG